MKEKYRRSFSTFRRKCKLMCVATASFHVGYPSSSPALENNLHFPGHYYDSESGLYYNGYRYYNPETGRYISSDPIGLRGGVNHFAYAHSNPIVRFDPTGTIDWHGSVSGGMFFTAGAYYFNLVSECVEGKRGSVSVLLAGPGFGFGVDLSGSYGTLTVTDSLDFVSPSVFSGDGFLTSAGISIPGDWAAKNAARMVTGKSPPDGYGCSALRLGNAGSVSCGPSWGLDFGAGLLYGTSTVLSQSIEDCSNCD